MTTPLEERIRQSLQQRAEDVEPTPALWQQVERRARRRWRVVGTWVLAGAATVLAAALIVPGLLDRGPDLEIGAEPPDAADPDGGPGEDPAPDPTPDPVPSEGDPGTGTVDGDSGSGFALSEQLLVGGIRDLRLLAPDGTQRVLLELAVEGESRVISAAARPGSTPDELTAAVLTYAEGFWDLRELRVEGGELTVAAEPLPEGYRPRASSTAEQGTVVGGPVWAPDGSSLAWVEPGLDGVPTLRIIGWTDEGPGTGVPATDNAEFALHELPDGATATLSSWTEVDAADGLFELRGTLAGQGEDGPDAWYSVQLERQPDGAWAIRRPDDVAVHAGPDLPGVGVAVGAPGDLAVPEMVRLAGGSLALVRDPYGAAEVLELGEGLVDAATPVATWLLPVDGGWLLVGSRSTATTLVVATDGTVHDLGDDVATVSVVR